MFWCIISGPARVVRGNVSQIDGGDKGPYKSCSHHGAILAICSRRNHFWPIPTKSLVEQVLPIMWAAKVIQMNLRIDQRSIRRYKKRGILKRYVLKRNFGEKVLLTTSRLTTKSYATWRSSSSKEVQQLQQEQELVVQPPENPARPLLSTFMSFLSRTNLFSHTFLDAILRWSKNFNKITSTLLYQKENTLKTSQL